MRLKLFLISFLLSLPFWWGVNIFEIKLENFLFAQISEPILQDNIIFKTDNSDSNRYLVNADFQELDIQAESAISVKIDNQGKQTILFEKNSDKVLPIASLTKLMTAFMIFEYPQYYNFLEPVTISKESINQAEGLGELKPGENILIQDLLHIMLIESSNDAAYSLAEIIGKQAGIEPEKREQVFIALMNLEAEKKLKLKNTKFVNSTGLDPDSELSGELKNISTAKDLVKLSSAILQSYPAIFEISSKLSYKVLDSSSNFHHLAVNKNKLMDPLSDICVNDSDWQAIISDIIGGKTGYTEQARGCIILVLKTKKGDCIINVILGAKNQNTRFEEMKKLVKFVI